MDSGVGSLDIKPFGVGTIGSHGSATILKANLERSMCSQITGNIVECCFSVYMGEGNDPY